MVYIMTLRLLSSGEKNNEKVNEKDASLERN